MPTKHSRRTPPAPCAAAGKKPYERPKEVQVASKKLEDLATTLRGIASKGIGEPDKDLEFKDVFKMIQQLEGSDKERDEAVKKFRLIQLSMAQFTDAGDDLSTAIGKIAKNAATRRDVAIKIRDLFEKLVEDFPDPTGDTIKIMLFDCYQAFEDASGVLANVASAGDDSTTKIDKQVDEVRKKSDKLVKAFEDAYKTSEKARKAKK